MQAVIKRTCFMPTGELHKNERKKYVLENQLAKNILKFFKKKNRCFPSFTFQCPLSFIWTPKRPTKMALRILGGSADKDMAAWVNGIALAVWVYTAANISGGHLNPAVSISTCVAWFSFVFLCLLVCLLQTITNLLVLYKMFLPVSSEVFLTRTKCHT